MNMMSLQERREEQAVPEFVRDIRSEFDSVESGGVGAAGTDGPIRTSFLERLAWFRDLSLAKKINTIFGTFLAVGVLMSLVLGLGLAELWNRYNASARVQEAVVAAGELQSAAGELRYHSVRALYDRSAAQRESQRMTEAEVMAQISAISMVLDEHVPEMAPRTEALGSALDALRSETERAGETVRAGGNANTASAAVAAQGDRLLETARSLAADLAARGESQEASGIAYFFNMVLILAVLALIGGAVLLLGLAYLDASKNPRI